MDFWSALLTALAYGLGVFVFIAALIMVIAVVVDLSRDPDLNGRLKALWVLFLVFLPLVTSLVYVIVRGRGMAKRRYAADKDAQLAMQYIKDRVGTSPTQKLASAHRLLQQGAIAEEEYTALKTKALAA